MDRESFGFDSSDSKITRILSIDSRGRISIPADIRKSFGLGSGSKLYLDFDLEKNTIILKINGDGK